VLKRGSIERVVLLHNGDVASIGSNLAADRLGTFLVRLGKVSERALEEAQDEATRTGKRIGQALLARGLIDTVRAVIVHAPDWTCARCGERVEGQFDACWRCSSPAEGRQGD
jgi:hypothetical protein